MMREPVEQCSGHLCIAEDTGPFTEGQVGCDDDRGTFVKLADQVEQELAAGLGEWEIAQFIEDQEVEAGDEVGGSTLPFGPGFGIEFVHQIDHVEEPAPAPGPDAGACNADGKVGLAGSGATDQDEVALVIKEVAGGQVADQGLIDLGGLEVELLQFLGERQLGDGHLVFDRARLLLAYLGGEQIADDLLGLVLAFYGGRQNLVIGGPHSVEPQLPHRVDHV